MSAVPKIYAQDGLIAGFYSGFGPILLKQIPYTMAKFSVQVYYLLSGDAIFLSHFVWSTSSCHDEDRPDRWSFLDRCDCPRSGYHERWNVPSIFS